jgi:hypothetical protein
MLPNTRHEVRKDLRLIDVRGRLSILSWWGRCMCLMLLELVYLGLKVVDYVVSVCERYSTVLHILRKLLQLFLHALDLQVLHGLELLKLMGLNLGGLLSCPQKDMVSKQHLVALRRATETTQKLPLLIAKVTLQVPDLLPYDIILLGLATDLLGEVIDFLDITNKMAPLLHNNVLSVVM